jgi:hypothetical protein
MSDSNELGLYPHSSLDGLPIPFDVILSIGCIKQDFTVTAANGISIPVEAELLVIYSDSDTPCYIQLDGNAAVPSNGVHTALLHFIPASAVKVIDPNAATTFGIVSANENAGTVHIETARKWRDSRNIQQHRNL